MISAKTIVLSADLHDEIVSYTSHLPHIVACLLVDLVKDIDDNVSIENDLEKKGINHFIGTGFKDVTRIASGSPNVWTDISLLNRDSITQSINELIEKLKLILEILDNKESDADSDRVKEFFEDVRNYKRSLEH